jgi:hypothetical protein
LGTLTNDGYLGLSGVEQIHFDTLINHGFLGVDATGRAASPGLPDPTGTDDSSSGSGGSASGDNSGGTGSGDSSGNSDQGSSGSSSGNPRGEQRTRSTSRLTLSCPSQPHVRLALPWGRLVFRGSAARGIGEPSWENSQRIMPRKVSSADGYRRPTLWWGARASGQPPRAGRAPPSSPRSRPATRRPRRPRNLPRPVTVATAPMPTGAPRGLTFRIRR